MKQVKIGIIGFGNMGSAHAACIYGGNVSGLKLAAICDNNPEKIEKAKKIYQDVEFFTDYKELIHSKLVDAILIAVPHRLHPVIGIQALEAGLHVLTEKPEAVSVTEARKMNEAAEKSGRIFGIMFNQRTNELFQKARELVRSGELGKPKSLVWIVTNWYRTQAYYDSGGWRATWSGEGGGVLLNQAPHNLDLLQWIFGMPDKVYAVCNVGKYHDIEVEDEAIVYGTYENGATATFITTTGEYPGTNRLEINGDLGKLVLENGVMKHWKYTIPERYYCFHEEEYPEKPAIEYFETKSETQEGGHRGILQNFTDAILNGTPLLAPGEEGIRELTISNCAYLSDWTKQTIEIPFDEKLFNELLEKRAEASCKDRKIVEESVNTGYKSRWQVNW